MQDWIFDSSLKVPTNNFYRLPRTPQAFTLNISVSLKEEVSIFFPTYDEETLVHLWKNRTNVKNLDY